MRKSSLTFVVVLGVAGALLSGCGSGDTPTPSRVILDAAPARTVAGALQGASPRGNFESATGVAGGVQVKGWMLDPDTANPIYAWVSVDGVGRHLYANSDRPDVGAAFSDYGSNHGFRGTIPASPGSHRVCVTASNVGTGDHTPLGCRTVAAATGWSPVGDFESATGVPGGIEVTGWMLDQDTPNPIYAWVTIDGAGRHLYANANRPDVGTDYPDYGPKHGLAGTIAASPGTHRVCVTAANTGPGSHTPLGCRTVSVPNPSPFGNFESARATADGIEVKGWMADPSAPSTPIYAWVTVDGAGRHLYAGGNRPDVGNAFPGYGSDHGLRGIVPASPGTHRVCVTASNIGLGNHTTLGCRTVTMGSGPVDDLVTVTDDSGRISVQVPGSWTEVDGTQYADGKGNLIYDVTASWSIADFNTGWAASGVAVSASSDALANTSVDEILDAAAGAPESAGCTLDGGSRQPYSDAQYTGSSDWWTGCGGVGSDYLVIAATADDGSHLLWVKLQMAPGDDWVREPILGSLATTF